MDGQSRLDYSQLFCFEDPLDLNDFVSEQVGPESSGNQTLKDKLCDEPTCEEFEPVVYDESVCYLPSLLFCTSQEDDQQVPESSPAYLHDCSENPVPSMSIYCGAQLDREKNQGEDQVNEEDCVKFRCDIPLWLQSDVSGESITPINPTFHATSSASPKLEDCMSNSEVPQSSYFDSRTPEGNQNRGFVHTASSETVVSSEFDGSRGINAEILDTESQSSTSSFYVYDAVDSSQGSSRSQSEERELDSCATNDHVVPNPSIEE